MCLNNKRRPDSRINSGWQLRCAYCQPVSFTVSSKRDKALMTKNIVCFVKCSLNLFYLKNFNNFVNPYIPPLTLPYVHCLLLT